MKEDKWSEAVRRDGEECRERKLLEQAVDEYVAKHLPRLLGRYGPMVPAQQLGVLVIRVEGPATADHSTDRGLLSGLLSDEHQLGRSNGRNGRGL